MKALLGIGMLLAMGLAQNGRATILEGGATATGRSRNVDQIVIPQKFDGSVSRSSALQPDLASTIARSGLEQKLGSQIPMDLQFLDELGQPVRLRQYFGGKPVILVLAYYECPNLCTVVLNGLVQTAWELKLDAGKDYQIVVVSIDPRERPQLAMAKKRTYVRRYGRKGADAGWHFLTGSKAEIDRVAQAVGFHFAWDEASGQFAHPSSIIILTPEGKISRYFPGIEYPPKEVRLALIEASENRVGSLAERLFLLCFHYNPQTGKYGLLIWRVMQLSGCGTAVLLFAGIGAFLWRERNLEGMR